MTPKEKATELAGRYKDYGKKDEDGRMMLCIAGKGRAKQCALIAVEEIIDEVREFCDYNHYSDRMTYWQEVKKEIEQC